MDKSAFWRDDRDGQFSVAFHVRGTILETIRAGSLDEARAAAVEMMEAGGLELYADDFDSVQIDDIRPAPPMYLVNRNGKEWGVSHIEPGDEPREPNGAYEASKYRPPAAPDTPANAAPGGDEGEAGVHENG